MKIWEKLVKTRRSITRLKISNYRKIFCEKIEFEYYILNVFLIAEKCILLNNSASFLTHWVAMHPDAPYFSILLCLTPDDFTRQGDSAGA